MTETADVLAAKQVAFSVAGGGGGGQSTSGGSAVSGCCGGGALRVRVGVGHSQEVGAEVGIIGAADNNSGAVYPMGKIRYKLGFAHRLAFVAGSGLAGGINTSGQRTPVYIGSDAAIIASTVPLGGAVQVYGGGRFTFSLPADSKFYENSPTQGFIFPLGVAFPANRQWQLFIEGGLITGISEVEVSNQTKTYGWIGGYGAVAFQYASRTQ
jgi:hypothetical protein